MNLYLRLIWLLLTYRFKPKMAFTDILDRPMRVMPGDLDINGHVNNGRYLTLVDLAIIETFLRSGVLFKAFRQGWRPMLGGSLISYRRGLAPFAKYTLRFQLQSWDERWNYFRFEFIQGGKTAAVGYAKGAMVGAQGWISNAAVDAGLSISRREPIHPPELAFWISAEQSLAANIGR